jgi:DNA-nicking Smr family endonuclease
MDFGKILDQWDKQTGPVYNIDAKTGDFTKTGDSSALSAGTLEKEKSAARRKRLLNKSPEATIDLHGLTRDEAWDALTIFFNDAKNNGLEKVLVIHGKGNHSGRIGQTKMADTGVLKRMVRDFIERCPFAGESGYSNGRSGGEGSSWVLLKTNRSSVPDK